MWFMGQLRRLSNDSKKSNQEGDMEDDATYGKFPSILKLNQKIFQNDGNEISTKQ